MTYGITGNTTKDALWEPVTSLTRWLHRKGIAFVLHPDVAEGLVARGLADDALAAEHGAADVAERADVLLSYGGDGTLLRTAHRAGETPILGVNIGRLGFLTKVEVSHVEGAIEAIQAGRSGVEARMTLAVEVSGTDRATRDEVASVPAWALNDVVIDKSGTTSMIQVEAAVDGAHLNTYWADGLVVATPTGSTAYALSVGGPILVPGTDVVAVAPIAPHTLTARPIVLPCDAELVLRVETRGHPFAFAVDGVSTLLDGGGDVVVRVRRSEHAVRLVTLPDRDYFSTIREKAVVGPGGGLLKRDGGIGDGGMGRRRTDHPAPGGSLCPSLDASRSLVIPLKTKTPPPLAGRGRRATRTRLELATSCVTGRRSNQLNYRASGVRPNYGARLGRGRAGRSLRRIFNRGASDPARGRGRT